MCAGSSTWEDLAAAAHSESPMLGMYGKYEEMQDMDPGSATLRMENTQLKDTIETVGDKPCLYCKYGTQQHVAVPTHLISQLVYLFSDPS